MVVGGLAVGAHGVVRATRDVDIVCAPAAQNMDRLGGRFDEMVRILAPGGRLVLGDACRNLSPAKLADPLFRRSEEGHVGLQRKRDIEAMLTRAAVGVTSSRHVWLHLYALVGAERPAV